GHAQPATWLLRTTRSTRATATPETALVTPWPKSGWPVVYRPYAVGKEAAWLPVERRAGGRPGVRPLKCSRPGSARRVKTPGCPGPRTAVRARAARSPPRGLAWGSPRGTAGRRPAPAGPPRGPAPPARRPPRPPPPPRPP